MQVKTQGCCYQQGMILLSEYYNMSCLPVVILLYLILANLTATQCGTESLSLNTKVVYFP